VSGSLSHAGSLPPVLVCVPLTRCPISRTREAPYRYRYACFGVTGQSPLLGTGSREHRPAMAFSIFAPGAPLKLALVWNLGRYSAVQTTCICCHYQLSALLRATTKRKGQKCSFSSRRGGLRLARHCTTARTWLWWQATSLMRETRCQCQQATQQFQVSRRCLASILPCQQVLITTSQP
jgi:hypothetical protein